MESMHRISVAPMLDVTNTYFRYFMRQLTRRAPLYSEMIHTNAILLGKKGHEGLLAFHPAQHPIVLQLGGCQPEKLAQCAKIAAGYGYDEVNLNVGCPSPRVQAGSFGACLMKEPDHVAECLRAMREASGLPCTVKCRLGIDDLDSYEFFRDFIDRVSTKGGVKHFIVHARKALLKGLNPAQNRSIPPLRYQYVYDIKRDFPDLRFTINGGFKTYEAIEQSLRPEYQLEGVMLGRISYEQSWFMGDLDRRFYGVANPGLSREEVLRVYAEYVDERWNQGEEAARLINGVVRKPLISLFHGVKNSKEYRALLSCSNQEVLEYGSFSEYIDHVITELARENQEALAERCPAE